MRRLVLISLGTILMVTTAAASSAFVPVTALRGGGYVILIRHGSPDLQTVDARQVVPADCTTQRLLSSQGREEARGIGAGFRTLEIPVGLVLSSPYCRALETARLAFGRAQPLDALLPPTYIPVPGAPVPLPFEERARAMKELLATVPAPGANTLLVSHGETISVVTQLQLAAGESAVYRPDGQGGARLIARIPANGWK